MSNTEATGRNSLGGASGAVTGLARLAIGLVQGAALWWLYHAADHAPSAPLAWPASVPQLFGPLVLVFAFVPVVMLAGVGRLRWMTFAVWTAVAAVVLGLLGWHDVARQSAETLRYPPYLNPPLLAFAAAALFISHHLVVPADRARRWIAPYPDYFDTAWKAGVQLALSLGFTLAFWILLQLGSALFDIIGLKFLSNLIREEWFAIPVTTLVFAVAVHLTDVRDGLIRGVRSVALMLLSWLLLLMTVLVAAFLAALPFTGLSGLWETGSATALVLSAAGALIILVNTAYQDGQADNLPPMVLRVAVRIASVLLTPLIIIAVWGLALRIGQYGLTPDRIIACACALVGAAYAGGYGWAALSPFWRKSDWMKPLERTNIWTAVLTVAVILALFSPLLDPARLSVTDQVARLERGAVTPDKFDYRFLRFESGKAGEAALTRLARSGDARIRKGVSDVNALNTRWDHPDSERLARAGTAASKPFINAWPARATLPAAFLNPAQPIKDNRITCVELAPCLASWFDLNGDGRREILLATGTFIDAFEEQADHSWRSVGYYNRADCSGDPAEALRRGKLGIQRPVWPTLTVDGRQLEFQSYHDDVCGGATGVPREDDPTTVADAATAGHKSGGMVSY